MNDDPYPGAINFNNLNKQIKRIVGISKMPTMRFAVFKR